MGCALYRSLGRAGFDVSLVARCARVCADDLGRTGFREYSDVRPLLKK
jgi:hypothetical protein